MAGPFHLSNLHPPQLSWLHSISLPNPRNGAFQAARVNRSIGLSVEQCESIVNFTRTKTMEQDYLENDKSSTKRTKNATCNTTCKCRNVIQWQMPKTTLSPISYFCGRIEKKTNSIICFERWLLRIFSHTATRRRFRTFLCQRPRWESVPGFRTRVLGEGGGKRILFWEAMNTYILDLVSHWLRRIFHSGPRTCNMLDDITSMEKYPYSRYYFMQYLREIKSRNMCANMFYRSKTFKHASSNKCCVLDAFSLTFPLFALYLGIRPAGHALVR